MRETFIPKHNYAKAFGVDMRISTKSATLICKVIKNKPLNRARRLLEDLSVGRRSLEGKYYTKTVKAILQLLQSCEKNAGFLGLDNDRLFVHASAHQGTRIQRRRRKGAFGSTLKNTNMEILLVERGKERKDRVSKKKVEDQLKKKDEVEKELQKENEVLGKEIEGLEEEQNEIKEDIKEAEKNIQEEKKELEKDAKAVAAK